MGVRDFRRGDEAGIRAVMEAAYDADRMPGWTRAEIEVAISRLPVDPEGTLVAEVDAPTGPMIAGYWASRFDDLRVHPDHRRRGLGRALFEAAAARTAAQDEPLLVLHVPTHLPGSVAFATAMGLAYRSSLWQFRLPAGRAVPAPTIPDGLVARHWTDDLDVDAFVDFATAAWEGHPSPLGLTPELARHVAGLPNFDPTGICLLAPADDPARPIAFTKVEIRPDEDGSPTGWIGQIAVLPAHRGRGLGRLLLEWGVAFLRARGASWIDLAVEAENERALGLYRRTGFRPVVAWDRWARPVSRVSASVAESVGRGAAGGGPAPESIASGGVSPSLAGRR